MKSTLIASLALFSATAFAQNKLAPLPDNLFCASAEWKATGVIRGSQARIDLTWKNADHKIETLRLYPGVERLSHPGFPEKGISVFLGLNDFVQEGELAMFLKPTPRGAAGNGSFNLVFKHLPGAQRVYLTGGRCTVDHTAL